MSCRGGKPAPLCLASCQNHPPLPHLAKAWQYYTTYSLFTLTKPRSPLILNEERGFLRMNRLQLPEYPTYSLLEHFLLSTRSSHITFTLRATGIMQHMKIT